MSLSIKFDERKLAALQKKLGPDTVLPPVGALISRLADLTQREAKSRAPGVLVLDRTQVSALSAKVAVSHPGARAMEAGRKPLAAGGKFPPPSAFAYITSDPGQQFAIASAVARRGVKGRFFWKKARAAASRALPGEIRKAAEEIAQRWSAS